MQRTKKEQPVMLLSDLLTKKKNANLRGPSGLAGRIPQQDFL